jgi:hypothetical protein
MLYKIGAWVLLLILLALVLIMITYKKREMFFVAYNNSNVPINKQTGLDESDVSYLNSVLNEYNTSSFPNTNEYDKYIKTKKSTSPLSSNVQDLIGEKVINTLRIIFSKGSKYRGDRLSIRSEDQDKLYDLYWKRVKNDIHCVFKMDITNKEKGWSRTFKIYLVIVDGTSDVDISIKTISLEEFSYLSFQGMDLHQEAYPMYYNIQNTLHLMDPYLTSGREMKITDNMRKNFENELQKKYLS